MDIKETSINIHNYTIYNYTLLLKNKRSPEITIKFCTLHEKKQHYVN